MTLAAVVPTGPISKSSAARQTSPGPFMQDGRRQAGRRPRWDVADPRFTVEEYRVVRLAAVGLTDKEIGRTLYISEWTVRYHLRKVFERFALRRRLGLVLLLEEPARRSGRQQPAHGGVVSCMR